MNSIARTALAVGVAVPLLSSPIQAQQTPQEYLNSQSRLFFKNLNNVSLGSRVRNIWMQLHRRSGRMYPIYPVQQYTIGQALPTGVIVLDVSIAGDPHIEVTAWSIAHEWGHHALGHSAMLLTPLGRFMTAYAGTSQEDAADRYAGRFLRAEGYAVSPVLKFLCDLPGGEAGDSHSSGEQRARNVAQAFGSPTNDPCGGDGEEEEVEEFEIGLRIWRALSDGVPARMDIEIDGSSIGSLTNIPSQQTLDLGSLKRGKHAFTITDAIFYDQYGAVLAYGLQCSGYFNVTRSQVFRLWALLNPTGEVRCGVRQ